MVRRFENGNFNVKNEECGKPPKMSDFKDAFYDKLLNPSKTVHFAHYRLQMIGLKHVLLEKRPEWKT